MPNPNPDQPNPPIREMAKPHIARCIWVRTQTRENRWSMEALQKLGITESTVAQQLDSMHKGWVCEQNNEIVGFSMCDRSTGEFWVVAVLPNYERRGIGTRLIESGQQWLHENGWPEIWLWTSPDTTTSAYKLYRKLGWQDCGVKDGQLFMLHKQPPIS